MSITCVLYPIPDPKYHVSDPNTKYLKYFTVVTLKLYSHNSYTKWLFPIQYYSNVLIVQLPSNCPPTSWYCESANWCSFCTGLLILWWSIQSSSTEYFTVQLLVQNSFWVPLSVMASAELLNWVPLPLMASAELPLTFLVPSGWARLQNTAYLNKIITNKIITNKIITWSIKLDT